MVASRFTLAIAFLTTTNAFTLTSTRTTLLPRTSSTSLFVDGPEDGTTITSARKELTYDASTGRLFETDLDPHDCFPGDEYCVIDKDSGKTIRLTLEEKERIFLDALQSYYFNNRQLLNDAEFDLLKEDLSWNGSPVVNLNRKEAKYLAAVQAYLKGTPTLSDSEFDSLKAELKEEGSPFASSKEPRCYIDTGICTVTYQPDKFRNNLLYLPIGSILTLAWLAIGFEIIEPIIRLNPIILALIGAPFIYNGSISITDTFIFPNNKIVYGPCPSCGTETRVYFGDILGVEGFSDVAGVRCDNCKATINVQKKTLRASTLPKDE
jgi:hypothetical protein